MTRGTVLMNKTVKLNVAKKNRTIWLDYIANLANFICFIFNLDQWVAKATGQCAVGLGNYLQV